MVAMISDAAFRLTGMRVAILLFAVVGYGAQAEDCGRTLLVGPGQQFLLPSEAAAVVRDGDCVKIDAYGVYDGDVARWDANNLHIKGYNGRPKLRAKGQHYGGKALWVVAGDNTTIEYVEISGVTVPDKNGAAIRHQGRGLILRRVYLHHNEAGLLTANDSRNRVLVEYSEIAHNGFGDGYSHNIYVGTIDEFILRFSYVHHANVGHNVKSRAKDTRILYNRIMDEYEGESSYLIDIPFGGYAEVIGNSLQQGRNTRNKRLLAYGAENLLPQRRNELYVVFNTLINDKRSGGVFVWAKQGDYSPLISNNLFYGRGKQYQGPGKAVYNAKPGPADMPRRRDFDYRLGTAAVGIDEAVPVVTKAGKSLTPTWAYRHRAQAMRRSSRGTADDIGAYEQQSMVVYGRRQHDWLAGDEPTDGGIESTDSTLGSSDDDTAVDEFFDQPVIDLPTINEPVLVE